MKRSEWYKEEQKLLINANLPIEAKDYIQGVLDRALLMCGTIYGDDLK